MGRHVHGRRISLGRLISEAQSAGTDDSTAMNEIIRRFDSLARHLAVMTDAPPHLHDDLANEARIALVKAVRRHDRATPGFPQFAKTYMRGAVWRAYHRWLPPMDSRPLADLASEEVSDTEHVVLDRLAPWGDGDVAAAVQELKPTQLAIMRLRYVDDAPLREIADTVGTTASAVSQRLGTVHREVTEALAA